MAAEMNIHGVGHGLALRIAYNRKGRVVQAAVERGVVGLRVARGDPDANYKQSLGPAGRPCPSVCFAHRTMARRGSRCAGGDASAGERREPLWLVWASVGCEGVFDESEPGCWFRAMLS
jgi:hypothetical protein